MVPLIILGIVLLVAIGLGPRYFKSKNTDDIELPIPKKIDYESYFKKYLNELYPYNLSNIIHRDLSKIPYDERTTIQLKICDNYNKYDILTKEQYEEWNFYSQYVTIELNVLFPKNYTFTQRSNDPIYKEYVKTATEEFYQAMKEKRKIGDGKCWRVSPVWIESKAKHMAHSMINNK